MINRTLRGKPKGAAFCSCRILTPWMILLNDFYTLNALLCMQIGTQSPEFIVSMYDTLPYFTAQVCTHYLQPLQASECLYKSIKTSLLVFAKIICGIREMKPLRIMPIRIVQEELLIFFNSFCNQSLNLVVEVRAKNKQTEKGQLYYMEVIMLGKQCQKQICVPFKMKRFQNRRTQA